MDRRKLALVAGSIVLLAAACGLLAWHFWPEPPPTTANQVYGTVMTQANPLEMSPEELDRWVNQVADVVERLPAHEFQKLLSSAMSDEEMRKRFESLKPETRRKLMNLISEEQRARMMAEMAQGMVAIFKAMPKPLRDAALRKMHEQGQRQRAQRGGGRDGHPEMTKQRFAEFQAATTPRQRATFVRAMREMRAMMESAGISH